MGVYATALKLKKLVSAATPPAGSIAIYPKDDGNFYIKDSNGNERPLIPTPDQLHQNVGFDLTAASTAGNPNTGTVASREMPTGWDWSWSYPTTALAYPTLVSDGTITRLGLGKSLKVSWAGNQGINQYLWSTAWAAPERSVIKVSMWSRSSASHMGATVGIITAANANPSVFVSGYQAQASAQVVSVGSFTKTTYTAVVPQGHTHARLQIVATNNSVGAGDLWFDDTESEMQIIPPSGVESGEIKMWPTASAPTGYLLCDGSEKPVADYPVLDALLGTTFGARTNGMGGAGTTHFRLPDFKGRVPLGVGTASPAVNGGTAHTLAQKGGEETHTLTINEMPSHGHNVNPVHINTRSGDTSALVGSGSTFGFRFTTAEMLQGGGAAHNVLSPFLGINFIIKT